MTQDIQKYIDHIVQQRPFAKEILNSYRVLVELMQDLEVSTPQIQVDNARSKSRKTLPGLPRSLKPF